MENHKSVNEQNELLVIESIDDVQELEQRYEYEDTVWLCKYTVHF
ncbi:hypothetical protein R1T43_05765 [Alteromonas sp. CI.11.F.A3]|nr:hypothetical protein [Alteromonas sp. CI.11.F.A3]WOI38538.1 hypothetical protein R1T43_05765 [Alteromonas sp. CI.11.F.A3]